MTNWLGFRVEDRDKMTAYYRVAGDLEAYLAKRDKRTRTATPPGTFEEAFGSTGSGSSGPGERVAVGAIGKAKTNKEDRLIAVK